MITREDIKKLEDELNQARNEFAIQQCPLNVGDTVDVCGYAYKGKKIKITSIRVSRWSFEGDWSVLGAVLKADGKPGKNNCEFSEKDYKKYLESLDPK